MLAERLTQGIVAAEAAIASERTIAAAMAAIGLIENFDMSFYLPFPYCSQF
jgi:hypothetical protein